MNDLQPSQQTAEECATALTTSLEMSADDSSHPPPHEEDDASFSSRNHNHSPPSSFLVNFALVVPQIIFGLGSVIAALGLPACNPFVFALFRECSAGIILLSAAAWSLQSSNKTASLDRSDSTDFIMTTTGARKRMLTELLAPLRGNPVRFLLLGLAIYGNQAGAITGIKLAGPVTAAVWQPSQPIMTAAICMAMRWEPINYWRVGGILLAVLGCILMMVLDYESKSLEEHDDATEDGNPVMFLVGNFLFFINCLGTSLYVILSKNVLNIYAPLIVTAWSYSIAALLMALTTLVASTSTSFMAFLCPECTSQWHIPLGALFALAYFILFNSCAAYAIITWANNYATGTLVMGYTVLQPVTAALLTLLLLALGIVSTCEATEHQKDGKSIACLDPPGWGSLCGMVSVFAGLYLMITTEPKSRNDLHYDPVVAQDPT
jgi:drug/metabolite transporter (DMT)-like permease